MSDAFYGFTAKGLEQETKKVIANPDDAAKRKKDFIEGAKSTATGVVTGTLGLPSDMLDLATMAAEFAAKFGDESVDNAYDYASMAKVMLPQIQNLQKKYGRQAFDEAFTAYTGLKSDASNPNQIIGELVGLGTAAKFGGKVLQKSADVATPYIEKGIDAVKNIFKDPPDIGPKPEFAGVKNVDDINKQTDKLIDSKKDITTTNIPNEIPAEEFFNAPKINPTMAGGNTPTGKIQQEKFLQLEEQGGKTPEQLFDETGVYRGEDGKLRWEIDDRDAELLDVDLSAGKKYSLSNLLKFDDLYKEYYKTINVDGVDYQALKNVEVEFISDTKTGARAVYNHDRDLIQINVADLDKFSSELRKQQITSSLLHEIQHAIQRREGFSYGSSITGELKNSPNYEEYVDAVEFLKGINKKRENFVSDNIIPHLKQGVNQKEAVTYFDNLISQNKIGDTYYDLEKFTDLSNKQIKKFQETAQEKFANKEIISRALVNQEEAFARKAYADKYGEREARLVQARFEKRLKYKKFMNNPNLAKFPGHPKTKLFSEGKLKDTSFLLGKNPKTIEEKGLKQMGGFDKTTQKSDIQTKNDSKIQASENIQKLDIDYDYIKPSREFYDQLSVEDMSKLSDTNLENLVVSNGELFESNPFFDSFETNPKSYKAAEIKEKALFNEFDARKRKYLDRYKKIKSIIDENPEDIYGKTIDNTVETLYENQNQFGKEIDNLYANFEQNSLAYQQVFLNNFESMFADLGLAEKGYKYNKGGIAKQMRNLGV